MLFELRTYELQPGKALEYLDLFCTMGVERVTRYLPMGGYWLTDSGRLNAIHHLWIYRDLAERATCRAAFAGDRPWAEEFVPRAFPLIQRQQTAFLSLQSGSPALDAAVARRREIVAAIAVGGPVFAEGLLRLSVSSSPMAHPAADLIADWSVVSGDRPASRVRLERVGLEEALAPPAKGLDRSELLRPLSVSPIA